MLKPGEPFERFTIEEAIGQGGMGCVYRAHDARLGRRVAVKVISDGAQSAEANVRLVREARAAAALDHPNAVAIFDVGEVDGAPYIVMELCEGRTLRAVVSDAEVPLATRVAQLADVGRALAGAHRRGLIHRDVKPENVMVRTDGVVKVLDFGIARRAGGGTVDSDAITQAAALPTLTVDGVKLGTPVYMAPEQIRSEALDGRSDQFSWGVLAYELLTGRLPWRGGGDMFAVMASILTDPVDRAELDRAAVPAAIGDVVLRALSKRPDDRFASMDEVVKALDAAAAGKKAAAAPQGATEAQRFSTGEVREVLERAIDQQARQGSTKLGFDDLLAVAEEMGVDPGSLREASRAVRARAEAAPATDLENAAKRDAWIRRKRRAFHRHAGVYAIINGALLVLGLVLLSFTPWWIWFIPALAWGIGLAIHGLVALTANADDWAEHNEGMQWWLDRQKQRHEVALARAGEKAARKNPALREEPRRRVEAAPADKVRVAALDTGRERAAEEEAALAEARASDVKQRRG